MAISAGDWSSATDPFILALDVAYTSTVGELSFNRIKLNGSEGLLNGIIDKDLQDLFWQNDGDPDKAWPVNAMQTAGLGPAAGYPEFGGFDKDIGGGTYQSFAARDMVQDDPKTAYVFTTGRSAGAVLYSLFAYVAYTWNERDPAQILFSWIAHHLDNSVFSMKSYLDQTSFQNASTYYDANPAGLAVIRETGASIAEQTKDLFDHVADFLAIAPNDATGAVTMRILVRGALPDRTTAIDLEGNSIASYLVRPTDRYRIDRMDATFGALTMIGSGITSDEPTDYIVGFPIEFPSSSRNTASQKVGPASAQNKVELSLPYHRLRSRLLNHLDLRFWKDDQDEVEIEFADWSHFNFEAGDMVHLDGAGYDRSENFLATEKTLDLDTLTASARFLQLRGHDGTAPIYADAANVLFCLRANSLGYFVDGTSAFPKQVAKKADPRNLDRWFDEGGAYCHAQQIDRGTGGPAGANPTPPQMVLDAIGRWPALEFDAASGLQQRSAVTAGLSVPSTGGATKDFTIYAVLRVDSAVATGAVWSYFYSGTGLDIRIAAGVPKYVSGGVVRGSGAALTGWQIVVWTLKAASSSTVRRNGVVLYSSGPYTAIALNASGRFAIGCDYDGNANLLDGAIAELVAFDVAHSVGTTEAIEAHLSEKYGIAI